MGMVAVPKYANTIIGVIHNFDSGFADSSAIIDWVAFHSGIKTLNTPDINVTQAIFLTSVNQVVIELRGMAVGTSLRA